MLEVNYHRASSVVIYLIILIKFKKLRNDYWLNNSILNITILRRCSLIVLIEFLFKIGQIYSLSKRPYCLCCLHNQYPCYAAMQCLRIRLLCPRFVDNSRVPTPLGGAASQYLTIFSLQPGYHRSWEPGPLLPSPYLFGLSGQFPLPPSEKRQGEFFS
jgi:hypothetical protein